VPFAFKEDGGAHEGQAPAIQVAWQHQAIEIVEEAAAWLDGQDSSTPRQARPQTPRIARITEIADRDDEDPGYLR